MLDANQPNQSSNDPFDPASGALEALLNNDHPEKMVLAEWARQQLNDPTLFDRDHDCTFWREGWNRCAERGLQGMVLAKEFGGQGLDLVTAMLRFEGLGLGCDDAGLVFGLSSQIWTMQMALERFGSDEQRQHWLPLLASGQAIGSFAITELDSGSDAFALTTEATKTEGGYVLNGVKSYVTMAPVCDVILVFVTTNPAVGRWGVTAFLVDAKTPGMTVGPNRSKMGLRTTPFADVTFTDCEIPESARIGGEGSGAAIFSAAMESERGFLLAGSVGQLERHINQAVAYSNDRKQFGKSIGEFQSVSHEIADMKFAHETARLMLYKAAALQARGEPSMMAAALAKLSASEAAVAGAMSLIQIHGARGYVAEHGIERGLRDTVGGVIYGGSSGIQRNIIARLLGLPG